MRLLRTGLVVTVVTVVAGLAVVVGGRSSTPSDRTSSGTSPGAAQEAYARLPMSFVPNQGQMPDGIGYGAQGRGYSLGLTPVEAVFAFSKPAEPTSFASASKDLLAATRWNGPEAEEQAVLRMQLLGADPAARSSIDAPLPGRANFLLGDDPGRWQKGIPTYGRVTYQAVYPGVDVAYHGNQGQMEYDFIVAPTSDPAIINLAFRGAEGLRVDHDGDLVMTVAGAELRHEAPVIYQDSAAGRDPVPGSFNLRENGEVGFSVGAYDHSRPLVIDPKLAYSSYLGGAGYDYGLSIAVDYLGAAYIAGRTSSSNLPTSPQAADSSFNGYPADAFVAKLDPTGTALLYSTYLGGLSRDDADAVAVDLRGNAYIRGIAQSPDFPTTPGAFDRTWNGSIDAYVAKLGPDGSLSYSTYLGGAGFDSGSGIAVDRRGAAYVPGITGSPEFPTTPGAHDRTFFGVLSPAPPPFGPGDFDAFLTKVAPDGSRLEYSTFLGASLLEVGFEVQINLFDEAYVTGLTMSPDFPITPGAYDGTLGGPYDPYVAKFNRDGSALVYSTLVGGSGPEGALGLAVDAWGSAYISGTTPSPDFPTTPGAFDQTFNGEQDTFVTKLTVNGSALAYSTFLGGSGYDDSSAVAVSRLGEAYVTGFTDSAQFPTTADALARTRNGTSDAYLTILTRNGSGLAYSTYLGGSGYDGGDDVAVDLFGAAYLSGTTESPDFPTTPGAFDPTYNGSGEGFVSKISRL